MSTNDDETQILLTLAEVLFNSDTSKFWTIKGSFVCRSSRYSFNFVSLPEAQMRCCYRNALRKLLRHPTRRPAAKCHDRVGKVPWLVECSETYIHVHHELLVSWSNGCEEALPNFEA